MPVAVHLGGADREDNRLASALPDFGSGLDRLRQVNVVSFALEQALLADRFEKPLDRSVEQHLGRWHGFVAQIDLDRMTLAGADAPPVVAQRKPLLVAAGDDLEQFVTA